MIGRAVEIAAIRDALGRARVVTLAGPGGAGKSTIARAVADTTAGAVLVALTGALEAGQLEATLERTEALVVLDDADLVLDTLPALLARTKANVLVTSREPLRIEGELLVDIGPLPIEDGIALYRAVATDGDAHDDDVAALVTALEGLPLAIELAGLRAKVLPPRALLERLERAPEDRRQGALLKSDRRDAPARHASMDACVAWSWERLGVEAQRAATSLAAFAGPVLLEDLERAMGSDIDAVEALDILFTRAMVRRAPGAGVRLALSRFVRDFARALPGADEACEVHASIVLAHVEALAARAYGRGALDALDALGRQAPEVLRAVPRAAPEVAARLALAIGDLIILRHVVDLRGPFVRDARAAADTVGDPTLRVRLRVLEAKALLEIGQPRDAKALLDEALGIEGNAASLAEARRSLGWALLALGEAREAAAVLDGISEKKRSDVRSRADALAARGLARCFLGALPDGHRDLETAHALHTASGDVLRRDKVAEMARLTGLALAGADTGGSEDLRASAEAHRAAGRLWRAALDLVWLAHAAPPSTRDALLEEARQTAGEAGVLPELAAALDPETPKTEERGWIVAPEARVVRPPDRDPIELVRHGSLRRVLAALVDARLATPGGALSADALLEAGWPGEKVRYDSGMLRVYTAIRRLRRLGLEDVLLTRDDGYLLRPDVPFARER